VEREGEVSTGRARALALGTSLRGSLAAWAVALVVLVYDLATLAPDLTPYDAPELALAAAQLGLSHPIGQPLHTLVGALFAHLPGLSPLVGLGAMSALFHALTLVPACALAEQLGTKADPPWAPWARALVVGAVSLAVPAWECATRVEVYTMSSFGVAWAFAHAAELARAERITPRGAAVLGLALGLTGSVNAFHAALAALALAPLGIARLAGGRVSAAAFGALVAGGLAGLLPYLHVPLVGGRTDAVVWGAPVDGPSLAAYFRGADYGRNRGTPLADMLAHARDWLAWSVPCGISPLLTLGIAGHAILGHERGAGRAAAGVLALGTVALLCSHAVFHVDIVDYQNYLTPALVVGAAGTAALVVHLARAAGDAGTDVRLGRALAAGVAVLAALLALAPSPAIWARTRGADRGLGAAARAALSEAPEGAFVYVGADHWVAPFLYLQEIEGLRPDVVVVAEGLASSSWYWDHVARRHPELPPLALAGPGGRAGRIRRLFDASPERAIHVEDASYAAALGLPICDVGYLSRARPCPGPSPLDTGAATDALRGALARIDLGSPASDGALAAIALARGDALWRLGRTADAVRALHAGVPPSLGVEAPSDEDLASLARVPALGGEHAWLAPAALGDPRRLLFLEAMALSAADRPLGRAYLARAAELGLPEAAPTP
jgi:hypothetical protein